MPSASTLTPRTLGNIITRSARWAKPTFVVAVLVALFAVPPWARGSWGYAVEAVALVSLMSMLIAQNRATFQRLGTHGITLVALLALLTAAQLIKSKALFPFVSWSMYSARLSDPVVREYGFVARHRSGRVSTFVPARAMASLAYSRATNGVRNSLNHCFATQADDACQREKRRTVEMLQSLVSYANRSQEASDPIEHMTVVQRRLAPPYDLRTLEEREVLSITIPGGGP